MDKSKDVAREFHDITQEMLAIVERILEYDKHHHSQVLSTSGLDTHEHARNDALLRRLATELRKFKFLLHFAQRDSSGIHMRDKRSLLKKPLADLKYRGLWNAGIRTREVYKARGDEWSFDALMDGRKTTLLLTACYDYLQPLIPYLERLYTSLRAELPDVAKRAKDSIHEPLTEGRDQIRLFRMTDHDCGQVCGTLEIFDAESCPPFQAVSYEWTHRAEYTPDSDIILVDDKPLQISKGLHDFLMAYRHQRLHLDGSDDDLETQLSPMDYLWADQISINQNNTGERNHQVGMMDRIFSMAHDVIAWLGPENEIAKYLDGGSNNLIALDQASFWDRLWIQQEIVLARHVFLAADLTFVSASQLRHSPYTQSCLMQPALVLLLDHEHKRKMGLLEALSLFSDQACSDVRDKVYGLQGLVRMEETVNVDYALPPLDVYRQTVYKAFCIGGIHLSPHFERSRRNTLRILGDRMGFTPAQVTFTYEDVMSQVLATEMELRGSNDARDPFGSITSRS